LENNGRAHFEGAGLDGGDTLDIKMDIKQLGREGVYWILLVEDRAPL
jgi:hypothetical protein